MANSKENTQNPKDDQEKMADEGIQEHLEHTAENKQPESKDDVQNTDESTCLCNFFKKIAEWICPRKNKNSNKADENATENNDAAKQEEMKQTETVEQPKEQRKLSDYLDYLEIISKVFGISTIFGIFIGGYLIYNYLEHLGQLSIFPEAITNPYVFIATAIVYGSILLFCLIIIFIFYFTGVKLSYASHALKSIFTYIISILVVCEIFFFRKIYNNYEYDTVYYTTNLIIFLNFCFIFFLFGLEKNHQIMGRKTRKIIYITGFIIISIAYDLFTLNNKKLVFHSIHFVRFAETPQNSSWYLLHNDFQQNNGFQETNGINKSDLKKLKKYFTKTKQCSKLDSRENALYGYMAWNLGDTKVFCPRPLDNKIRYKNNPIPDNCIVISGKALQIMPTLYVSTEPIQQLKYDIKE